MNIQPHKAYVLLRFDETEEMKTSSGLIIAVDDKKKDYHGVHATVLAVGPEVTSTKEGERVIVNKYDALPFRYETETLQMVKEELVYAHLA